MEPIPSFALEPYLTQKHDGMGEASVPCPCRQRRSSRASGSDHRCDENGITCIRSETRDGNMRICHVKSGRGAIRYLPVKPIQTFGKGVSCLIHILRATQSFRWRYRTIPSVWTYWIRGLDSQPGISNQPNWFTRCKCSFCGWKMADSTPRFRTMLL